MIGGESVREVGQNRLGEGRGRVFVCRVAGRKPRGQECEVGTCWGPHFHALSVGGQPGMGL